MRLTAVSRLGFIGAGKIVETMAKGFIASGVAPVETITASAPTEAETAWIKKLGAQTTTSNTAVLESDKVIILAVKPDVVPVVLEEISSAVTDEHLIVSVAAGITLKMMDKMLPPGVKLARVMPNTPIQYCEGVSSFTMGPETAPKDKETVKNLFSSVGLCVEVNEKLMDIAAGSAGCGPAYVYTIIQAIADGAVMGGIPRKDAVTMASQTVLGAAKMVLESGKHPVELRDEVCSPGGATICGVHALESGRLPATIVEAVQKAAFRAKEIGDTFQNLGISQQEMRKVQQLEVFRTQSQEIPSDVESPAVASKAAA